MKKITVWVLLTLILGMTGAVNGFAAEAEDAKYEKLAQEAKRNHELLDIWKQHVRTLTQERDEAYKEIQQLKAGGAAVAPSAPPVAEPQNVDEGQVAALQKDLQEIKIENDRLIQEKERALSQLERQTQGLDASELDSWKNENQALKLQIQTLKAQVSNAEESSQLLVAENKTLQEKDRQRGSGDEKLVQELESARVKMQANVADMRNLKQNVDSYLDSLIAAFEERKQ